MSSNAATGKQSIKQLLVGCGSLDLGTRGARAELVKCINDHPADSAAAAASDPPREDPDSCDCLLATEIETGGEEDMRASASAALQAELDSDEIEIKQRVDGKLLAGGLNINILVELAELRNGMAVLQQRGDDLQQSDNEDFLDGPPTAVTRAYHTFLERSASEVRNIVHQNV